MLIRGASLALSLLMASVSHAAPETRTYDVEVDTVHAPNVLRVIPNGTDKHFYFRLADVHFGELANIPCTKRALKEWGGDKSRLWGPHASLAKQHCKRLADDLEGQTATIEILSWEKPVLTGNLTLNGRLYNLELIRRGDYRADASQTRSAAAYLYEREARCNYRGIWSDLKGIPAEQLKCDL